MIWYINNRIDNCIQKMSGFCTNLTSNTIQSEDINIYIDGYVVPRIENYSKYKNLTSRDLIIALYAKYKRDFIHYIKGIFTIVIFINDTFLLFSDRHSIRKYFVYRNDDGFCISNSLKYISDQYELKIDIENAAIFSLLSHFINGATLFKEVQSSKPGQIISYKDGILNESFYWQPENIIKNRKAKSIPLRYLAEKWQTIISNYIDYLKPSGISVTLTGGNDSRMVLAGLLSLNKFIHAFSFGNPQSHDGIIACKISKCISLNYTNYYIENPTLAWFERQAKYLIIIGNSLINIHRAHRNDALECEKNIFRNTEMLFTGIMGGEYIKEPYYNNVVIPKLFKRLSTFKHKKDALLYIENLLKSKGLIINSIVIPEVYNKILQFINIGDGLSIKEKKFIHTFLFYGCSHHTQDSNVFGQHIKYVINPFMDIDFLEMLSEYEKWYLNKKQNLFIRFFHSKLLVAITDCLNSELSRIPYAKKGEYTANELLRNKHKYLIKRGMYFIEKDKNLFPMNFPMGHWLFDFCEKNLNNISKEITDIFDINIIRNQLENIKDKKKEESWHIITNPINLNMIYEYYKKKTCNSV